MGWLHLRWVYPLMICLIQDIPFHLCSLHTYARINENKENKENKERKV